MRVSSILSFLLASVVMAKEEPTSLQIGIKKRIPKEDCPRQAQAGDKVKVHYVGTLFSNGDKFDSSRDRDSPFEFNLGQGQVIQGWDKGVVGMCIGELRKLQIPYDLAYGERGSPPKIPAKAALVFEVELIEIVGYTPESNDEL